MIKNTNRLATMGFALGGVLITARGLMEGSTKFVALGAVFLCVAARLFYSGRGTADAKP